jgi:hypothetical protein
MVRVYQSSIIITLFNQKEWVMRKLALLPAVIAATIAAQSGAQAATVEQLEERIIKLEKNDRRAKHRIRAMKKQIIETEEQFRVNGFFSAGFSTLKTPDGTGNMITQNFDGAIDDAVRAEAETLLGLQFTNRINEKTDLVTQIVGRGGNDFNAAVEWAFLKHALTDNITVRAGRLRTPLFAQSEFLEVNYAMPWVRAPQEVYGSSISSYTGFDVLYRTRLAGINLGAQVFYGSDASDADGISIELDKLRGMRLSAEYKGFNGSIGYSVANANITGFPSILDGAGELYTGVVGTNDGVVGAIEDALGAGALAGLSVATGIVLPEFTPYAGEEAAVANSSADFTSVALGYTNGPLDIKAESIRQRVTGAFQDEEANYLSIAYRIGDFTPYVTAARLYTIDDDERQAALGQIQGWYDGFATYNQVLSAAVAGGALPAGTDAAFAGVINDAANRLRAGGAELEGTLLGFTGEQTSYAVGIRWDFMPNLALKFEAQQFVDVINSPRFEDDDGVPNTKPQGDMDMYTISINGVF